ncbi:uncharacterized protein LOC107866029 [Capsicum annuum]|uniref:uncharacterized protein LOC107866029 n=1 Tax=Capsicum annuum TaxID=4072 RepID=UPI001FB0E391|nr:uncharacterized protein LOC107866029 [Capsicum annuum]
MTRSILYLKDVRVEGPRRQVVPEASGVNQFTVSGNDVTAKVNLLERSCSCQKFDLVKMSCELVMAALRTKYGDGVGYEAEWTVPQEVQDTKISPSPYDLKLGMKKVKYTKGVGETLKSKRRNTRSFLGRIVVRRKLLLFLLILVDLATVLMDGNGGGLHVASIRNRTNPLVVSQNADESALGSSLRFSPVDPKENTVRLSTDMNVKFTSMVISDSSTVWRIYTELIPQRYLVTVGGVVGNPGRETLGNWFKIDKYEDAYKLVYCPGVCNICRPFCGDIGVLVENGKRVLFVGRDKPLKVTFHKL